MCLADTRRGGLSLSVWAAHSRDLSAACGDVHGTSANQTSILGRSTMAQPNDALQLRKGAVPNLSGFIPIAIAAYCSTVASIDDLGPPHDRGPFSFRQLRI